MTSDVLENVEGFFDNIQRYDDTQVDMMIAELYIMADAALL